MSNYLQQAFNTVCKNAKPANGCYVVLMERSQYYGGPEEGGWWGTDNNVVAYNWVETEEEANALKVKIEQFAEELSQEARKEYGKQCLRESEWLEARGLDDSFLPEPDGPAEYYVTITEDYPQGSRGCRYYE